MAGVSLGLKVGWGSVFPEFGRGIPGLVGISRLARGWRSFPGFGLRFGARRRRISGSFCLDVSAESGPGVCSVVGFRVNSPRKLGAPWEFIGLVVV